MTRLLPSSEWWAKGATLGTLESDGVKIHAIQRALTKCLEKHSLCAYQNVHFTTNNGFSVDRYYAVAVVEAIDYFNVKGDRSYSEKYEKQVNTKEEWNQLDSDGVQFRALMKAFGKCRKKNDFCVVAGTTEDYAHSDSNGSEIGGSATVIGYELIRR